MKRLVLKVTIIIAAVISIGCLIYSHIAGNGENELIAFEVRKESNNGTLCCDYSATIENDSVKIFVPYLVNFNLMADFEVSRGTKVYCNGEQVKSGKSIVNYLKPQQFKLVSRNGGERIYTICIYNSGLPVVYINTSSKEEINRGSWIDGTNLTVYNEDGSVDYDSQPDLVKLKGRGSSTWEATSEKRPYGIKLNKKASILGMPKHNRWVLMANYYDATLFRNAFTNFISRKYTNQDWVPKGYSVELVLNGSHRGNYYLCEQVKLHKDRAKGDYLVEADIKKGIYRRTLVGAKSHNAFYIKDTKNKNLTYEDTLNVKNIIDTFETALYEGNEELVMQQIDIESFVDWYLIKEWSRDMDGNMCTSCYFTITEDNKIKMGPLWDFDLAWGGCPISNMGEEDNAYEGYYTTTNPKFQAENMITTSWFSMFIKMPAFQRMLKEKVLSINSNLDDILAYIDTNTEYLRLSASANNIGNTGKFDCLRGWGGGISGRLSKRFFNKWGDEEFPGKDYETYRKSMSELKNFVKTRMEWFVKEVNQF